MSETTMMVLMGFVALLGLTALVLGFVVLVIRGGSARLSMRAAGVEVESNIDSDCQTCESERTVSDQGVCPEE